jgi:hypothetical protein
MTDCSEQYENTCKGEFGELHRKLDRIDEALRGNGRPGLQMRLDRVEQDRLSRSRVFWLSLGAVGTCAATAVAMLITR